MCCHWFWFHIHPLSIRHFHPSSSAIFIPLHPRSPLSSGLVIDRVASLGASPSRSPFVAISLASSSPFSLHLLTVFLPAPHHLALIWLALCGASAGTPSVGPLLPVRLLSAPHSMPFHRTRLPVLPLIFPFSHQLVTVLPPGSLLSRAGLVCTVRASSSSSTQWCVRISLSIFRPLSHSPTTALTLSSSPSHTGSSVLLELCSWAPSVCSSCNWCL